jgi:AbrB family looped-hinge helix DNA binding protein
VDRYNVTILPGGRITIPAAIRKSLDIQTGDALIWFLQDGELHVRKAEPHEITNQHDHHGEATAGPPVHDHQSSGG